jgi:hypothetical protein
LKNLKDRADKFYERLGWRPAGDGSDVPPEFRDHPGFKAHRQLHWYDYYRSLSNFPHFYFETQVESDPQAVAVRKAFFTAEQLRKAGDRELALDTYREAMPKWRDILLKHTEFRRDPNIQEDTCEIEIKYLELVEYLYGKRVKQLLLVGDYLTQAAIRLPLSVTWLPPVTLVRDNQPTIVTPFSGSDEQKVPLIPDDVRGVVRNRMGLSSPMPVEPPPTEKPAGKAQTTAQ